MTETPPVLCGTSKKQIFNAARLVGTPTQRIEHKLAPGGHIGLFMGSHTLADTWPQIGHWIREQDAQVAW